MRIDVRWCDGLDIFLLWRLFSTLNFFPLLNLLLFIQLYFFTLLLGQTDLYVDRFIYKINNDKWSQADYWELRKISLIPVSAHCWNLLFILKLLDYQKSSCKLEVYYLSKISLQLFSEVHFIVKISKRKHILHIKELGLNLGM